MFRNIFLPERIGSYYLLPTRVAALELNKTSILCAVVVNSGSTQKLELCIEEPIANDAAAPLTERTATAIKVLLSKIGVVHHSIAVLPGQQAVLKEVTLPFSDPEKIRLVAPYEVEGLLPFSLADALSDAIPLQQEGDATRVLVAALQQENYRDYNAIFDLAEISPDRVTIDTVELIPLAQRLATQNANILTLLCDIGGSSTRVIAIANQRITLIRTVSRGVGHFGTSFDGNTQTGAVPPELLFTIESAKAAMPQAEMLIYLVGIGAEHQQIADLLHTATNIRVERVSQRRLLGDALSNGGGTVPSRYASVLEAARINTSGLSLDREREHEQTALLRAKQALVALSGAGLIFLLLAIYAIITVRGMSGEAYTSEQEAIERLRKVFALPAKNASTLEQAIANSERELAKEENIWFALSSRNRFSFLSYLQELSSRIDRESLGLEIRRFVMKAGESGGDDTLTIEGSVKDYDALRTLEEALVESKLFRVVPKLQETKFVISLVIDKKGGEV